MDSSTIMRSLIVDNIQFKADLLWQDFQMSSDSSFVKYSMDSSVGDGEDCPCMLPPPDFDIKPPPKPFIFMSDDGDLDGEFQVDIESSCPLDLPFLSNSNLPNERPSAVNEPLIFIITAATVMAMALIVFTIVLIWCQKKGWCKNWSKQNTKLTATLSSDTEESTANYSTGAGHKTEWSFNSMKPDKNLSHVPNLGILMYGGGSIQDSKSSPLNSSHQRYHHSLNRPLPTLPKPKPSSSTVFNVINRNDVGISELRSNPAYDSHNPVYEEISLNGLLPLSSQRKNDHEHCYATTGDDGTVDLGTNLLLRGENCRLSPKSFDDDDDDDDVDASDASASVSPCSCQSCGKSTSIGIMEISPSPKRKVSEINKSTQSEETFMPHDDFYCECTNNGGRESGYGTEGYPTRDNFGTWDSPKRMSPPTVPQRQYSVNNKNVKKLNTLTSLPSKRRPQNIWVTTDDKSKHTTTTGANAGGGGVGPPFAVFSVDNLAPSSAYV